MMLIHCQGSTQVKISFYKKNKMRNTHLLEK